MNTLSLKLKKGKELSLARKHPWVFSGAILQLPKGLADGQIVDVFSYDMQYLGTGHYQGGGSISVRINSFEQQIIDQGFWPSSTPSPSARSNGASPSPSPPPPSCWTRARKLLMCLFRRVSRG